MAMEERQTKIREGAGLEESRLNTEFIDMMKKWGPHLMTVLAVLLLAYLGYHKWEEWRVQTNDASYRDLATAAASSSPVSLEAVAKDHPGTPAAIEANLYAADLHMAAARTGIPVGEKLDDKDPSKLVGEGKSFLTDEQKKQALAEAERLYQAAANAADTSEGQQLLAIGALSGLASVAEDRGETEKAKSFYQQAMTKANALKYDKLEALLKKRMENADTLKVEPKLFAAADLPGYEKPVVAPVGGFSAKTTDGQTLTIGPGGQITPGTPAAAPGTPTAPVGTPVTIPGGGTLTLTPGPAPTTTTTPAPAPVPGTDPAKP